MSTLNRGIMSLTERRSLRARLLLGVITVSLILVSLIVVFPLFFAFSAGLKTSLEIFQPGLLWPSNPNWANYPETWNRLKMLSMFGNSMIVGLGGVLLRLLISSMAAYSLSRLKPVGGKLIEALILMTFALPFNSYLIPLYTTLVDVPIIHVSLLNTFWGLWIPYASNAFVILVLKNTFDQIPQEIYDAAKVDGASDIPMFFQFTLPLSKSIMLVLGLLGFITIWGDFLLPLLILRNAEIQTVSVRLYYLTRMLPINLHMAGAFIAILPPAILAVVLQRYIKGGLTF